VSGSSSESSKRRRSGQCSCWQWEGGSRLDVDAAQDIAPGVGGVGFPNVGQCLRVAENGQRFLELGEVFGTDEDRCIVSVAGDRHSLMLVLDAVHHLGEVVSDGAERFNGHGHNGAHREEPVHRRQEWIDQVKAGR